jgi:hypothetical protein
MNLYKERIEKIVYHLMSEDFRMETIGLSLASAMFEKMERQPS